MKTSTSASTTPVNNKHPELDVAKDEPRRPKTVKQLGTKFRSTGLFEEEEEDEAETVTRKAEKPPVKRVGYVYIAPGFLCMLYTDKDGHSPGRCLYVYKLTSYLSAMFSLISVTF